MNKPSENLRRALRFLNTHHICRNGTFGTNVRGGCFLTPQATQACPEEDVYSVCAIGALARFVSHRHSPWSTSEGMLLDRAAKEYSKDNQIGYGVITSINDNLGKNAVRWIYKRAIELAEANERSS